MFQAWASVGFGKEGKQDMKTTKISFKCAFETRYLAPTDARGSRVQVTAGGRTCTVPWDSELGVENHARAVREFQKRFNMADSFGDMYGVETTGGFVFMCAESCQAFQHVDGEQ